MTLAYISELVTAHPSIREIWLLGSQANGTAGAESDWDYLAFADHATLTALQADLRFKRDEIDLMVVKDGNNFESPWPDCHGKVHRGALEPAGWNWRPHSATRATYKATKWPRADECSWREFTQQAVRVYPAEAAATRVG